MALGYYNSRFTVSRLFSLPTRRGSVLSCRSPRAARSVPLSRCFSFSLYLSFSFSLSSHRERRDKEERRERERERASEGGRGWQSRTIREPLLPKRIMRGKIKFFSTRPFELHRPRDHALLLLVLYTVYTFRGMRSLPPSPSSSPFPSIVLFVAHFRRSEPHFRSFPEITSHGVA